MKYFPWTLVILLVVATSGCSTTNQGSKPIDDRPTFRVVDSQWVDDTPVTQQKAVEPVVVKTGDQSKKPAPIASPLKRVPVIAVTTKSAPRKAPPPQKPSWVLRQGNLRAQALAWGEQDPLWDVHWLADIDPYISISSYSFRGDLDEALIQVVESLASRGSPLRIERARANHQLIIRSQQ